MTEPHALLDRDLQEDDAGEANVHLLPVSMIENLLVDPLVIWEATAVVRHKVALGDECAVENAITAILDDLSETEVDRRIKAEVGTRTFRVADPVSSLKEQISNFEGTLREELSDENIAAIRERSEQKVKDVTKKKKRREFFHGKKVLEEFYRLHMHQSGMSKEIFIYGCARAASERKSVKSFVDGLLGSIGMNKV